MCYILPIVNPPIDCYPDLSTMLSIVLTDNNDGWFYSNFINLYSHQYTNQDSLKSIWLNFTKVNPLYISPYLNFTLSSRNETIDIDDFIKKSIQSEFYVYLNIDRYYIDIHPNRHNSHEIFVFGYNEHSFYVADYIEGIYRQIEIKKYEIVNAYNRYEFSDYLNGVLKIKKCKSIYNLNINNIRNNLLRYLDGKEYFIEDQSRIIHIYEGTRIYDVFTQFLLSYDRDPKNCFFDHRPFCFLYQHKTLMYKRLEFLINNYYIKDVSLLTSWSKVVENANVIKMLSLKFLYSSKYDNSRLLYLLTETKQIETNLLNDIICSINIDLTNTIESQ